MGDLSDFERGQITGARLAGASVTKTVPLLGVSRVTVSKVMSAYMNHGKTKSAVGETQHRKRLSYIEKGCFKKPINQCSTGDSRTEYSS
jgi:hypothetical protein